MKTCFKCGMQKEEHDFYKKTDNIDGFSGSCKKCCNAANQLHYLKAKADRAQQIKDFLNRKAKV